MLTLILLLVPDVARKGFSDNGGAGGVGLTAVAVAIGADGGSAYFDKEPM
jgi:hypothetical protein